MGSVWTEGGMGSPVTGVMGWRPAPPAPTAPPPPLGVTSGIAVCGEAAVGEGNGGAVGVEMYLILL